MPSLLDSYTDQTRCWFPDKDLGWVSGHVTNKHVDGEDVRIDFVDENGKVCRSSFIASRGRRGSEHPLSAHRGGVRLVKELQRDARDELELLGGRLAREKTALLRTGTRLGRSWNRGEAFFGEAALRASHGLREIVGGYRASGTVTVAADSGRRTFLGPLLPTDSSLHTR